MAEVLFYHMTESTLDTTLPGLVERSIERDWRVSIQFASEERRDAMDAHLWSWSDESFIGHGTDRDKWPKEQPVFLTITTDNPNISTVRFCVEGAECVDPESYQRLVIMFDGHDEDQLAKARQQWKTLKAAGHNVTYWQQNAERRWEKKA